eukprot:925327-Pelagomonas_calceolata.AAC.1
MAVYGFASQLWVPGRTGCMSVHNLLPGHNSGVIHLLGAINTQMDGEFKEEKLASIHLGRGMGRGGVVVGVGQGRSSGEPIYAFQE